VVAHCFCGEPAEVADDADLHERSDEHEQCHEEGQSPPLHLLEELVRGGAGDQHRRTGAHHRDHRGVEVQHGVQPERDHDQRQHDQTAPQQPHVGDGISRVQVAEAMDVDRQLQVVAEQPPREQHEPSQEDQGERQGVDQEVDEAKAGSAADDDVGWVADQRRRTADVGGQDQGDEVRRRWQPQSAADRECHRGDEQDAGDVVQDGGDGGADQHQQDEQLVRMPA
jgi:hypothetical protein